MFLFLRSMIPGMLRHFPQLNVAHAHRTRDYAIAAFTFFSVVVCLTLEANASLERQYVLGGIAFVSLIVMLLGENR
jgi:inner membrane protein involved in colicin E2 resistance